MLLQIQHPSVDREPTVDKHRKSQERKKDETCQCDMQGDGPATTSIDSNGLAGASAALVAMGKEVRKQMSDSVIWTAPKNLQDVKDFLDVRVITGPTFAFQKAPSRLLRRDMKRMEVRGVSKLGLCAAGGFLRRRRVYSSLLLKKGHVDLQPGKGMQAAVKAGEWEKFIGYKFLVRGLNHRNQNIVVSLEVCGICECVQDAVAKTPDGLAGLVGVTGTEGRELLQKALRTVDKEEKLVLFRPQQLFPVRTERQWKALVAVQNKLCR